METKKGPIKKIFWPKEVKPEIDKSLVHSIFHLGVEMAAKLEVGEPIQIILVDDQEREYKHYGLAEITSVKVTTIGAIEANDFRRQKSGFRSTREVLNSFRKRYPESRADITPLSPITVFTIKKLSYSLPELNKLPDVSKLKEAKNNKEKVVKKTRNLSKLRNYRLPSSRFRTM